MAAARSILRCTSSDSGIACSISVTVIVVFCACSSEFFVLFFQLATRHFGDKL